MQKVTFQACKYTYMIQLITYTPISPFLARDEIFPQELLDLPP